MQGLGITLDWPDKVLSPNARIHWARKAKAVKLARQAAWVAVLEHRAAARAIGAQGRAVLNIEFCPPDKRRRDLDNLIASSKALNDGIADALGIDDSQFVLTYRMGRPVKGGAVRVMVSAA